MKLLRLRLRGLRSFTRETEIDLARLGEQGLFAISGPTGAGKSTILDGIFLAFFGRCPRGEASECVSAGALELSVRLELTEGRGAEARDLAVERRFRWSRKKAGSAGGDPGDVRGAPRHLPLRIEERSGEGWVAADLGGRKAEDYLAERIVRVTMSDFQQAVVLPQGEFDALLRARPAERRTLVASLFRTEHLGQPLIEVLRGREASLRSEIGKLEEAEREVAVSEEDARAAAELVGSTQADAAAREKDLADADRRATALRLARQRCAARDAAAAALARVEKDLEARAPDRARVTRGRKAAGAQGAVDELERAEAFEAGGRARMTRTEAEARAAETRRKTAEGVLGEASAARAADLPRALEQLGRARQALERGRDLPALDADHEARAKELGLAEAAKRDAVLAHAKAAAKLGAIEVEEREGAARLEATRVGEDERAAAVAVAALTELALAEERLAEVIAAELAAADARVVALVAALATGEETAREALAEAERRRADLHRLEVEARRAADDVDLGEQALIAARREAAAADLAASLVAGKPCPVCGAKKHPGGVQRGEAAAIELAERGLTAARSLAKAADRDRAEGSRALASRDEEARAASARMEALAADLAAAREAARRQASGEEEPRVVGETRAAVTRLGARADVALSALALERRAEVREAALREPAGAAEDRIAALGRRAREAEALEQALAAARARAVRARADAGAKLEAIDRAERARGTAEGRASEAAAAARARREELEALLADLTSRGQGALFERGPKPRTAAAWVTLLEARTADLVQREEKARAALDGARGEAERLALEARGASVARSEATAVLDRARAAADKAIAGAGFEGLAALREALLDPAVLARLDADLRRLDEERERLSAVLAERRRDVDVEVSEAEAQAAEAARDEARREEGAARVRAAEAAARGEEIARRRARAFEIGATIAALEPRAQRLGQIRQVVMSNQLSELAAERHLEAVTRGAAALLKTLSSERYALVRDAAGAFAVSDAAHGGFVRPPSTLSGGEAFLVSLSLALSLSERIQLAGRTRFDFFFLDEGFGSLDAGTLEVALGALEQLRGPNRLIGMISHVPAIEDRMPRRLEVSTERRGGATVVLHEP
jgi:DNA repair protein SbcC/Rad50